jgi:hypothetical protein
MTLKSRLSITRTIKVSFPATGCRLLVAGLALFIAVPLVASEPATVRWTMK